MFDIHALDFRFPTKTELNTLEVRYCLFAGDKVLVEKQAQDKINPFLTSTQLKELELDLPDLAVGVFENSNILMTGSVSREPSLSRDYELVPLISIFFTESVDLAQLVGRAAQLQDWRLTHQYCGRCGQSTQMSADEYSRQCSACNSSVYPRISPCIITLVTRGEEFLLAKNAQTKGEWFSTLAGFVEPGESLEETLRREVFEEVGLQVGQIQYFGSQPWPFPAQLMVGFYAEYESGEIHVDGVEILEAQWFTKETMPSFPGEFSIAGQLINNFIAKI